MNNNLYKTSWWLVVIGGINWGLIGLVNWDLINTILGTVPALERLLYILIGVGALVLIFGGKKK